MRRVVFLFTITFLLISNLSYAQNSLLSIDEGSQLTLPCNNLCTVLHASFPKVKVTSSYTVNNIPFNPTPIVGTNVSLAGDDFFSTAIPIGFDFCFYNGKYSNVFISDNGHVTFNGLYSGVPSSFATQTALPYYNGAYPDNAIFGPFLDAKTSLGGSIKYATVGTAPFRKFVVEYNAVPFFNNNCTGATNNTFQIILKETYNSIECHLTNKAVCNNLSTNWLNYSTLGIQSTAGANFTVASGKNASIWNATNQAFEFVPNGADDYTVKWYNLGNINPVATGTDTLSTCLGSVSNKIFVTYQTGCLTQSASDTIILNRFEPILDSVKIVKPLCDGVPNGCITFYTKQINTPIQYKMYSPMVIGFQPSNQFCNLSKGGYQFMIQDAAGCIKDTFINLINTKQIGVGNHYITPDTCPLNIGAVSVFGLNGTGPYTYKWSNNDNDSILNNVAGDESYSVTVKDADGCTAIGSYYVPAKGLPKFSLAVQKATCAKPNGSISINMINNPSMGYTISSIPNVGTSNPLINLPSGVYNIKVTSSNGCDSTQTVSVNDTLNMNIGSNPKNTTCGLSNGQISAVVSAGIPPYTLTVNSMVQPSMNMNNLSPGKYYVSVSDSTNCIKTDTVTIDSSKGVDLLLLPSNAHCDSNNGAIGSVVTTDSLPVTYLWSNNAIADLITGLAVGNYWLKVTDKQGCTVTDTVIIGDDGVPTLGIVNYEVASCFGDSSGKVTLTGSFGIPSYKYSLDSINFSAVAELTNIVGGYYTIYIKDAASCIRDTTVFFQYPDSISVGYNLPDTLVCFDDTVETVILHPSGNFPPFKITYNNITNFDTVLNNLVAGNNLIIITDTTGCAKKITIPVNAPQEALGVNKSITHLPCYTSQTGQLAITPIGGWSPYSITWSDTNLTSLIRDSLSANTFQFTITDQLGCIAKDTAKLVQLQCCRFGMPNAFSPNGDGINETLIPIPVSDLEDFILRIYNRWGQQVFETDNLKQTWNGGEKKNSNDIETYFYTLRYRCTFSKEYIFEKGDVTLVR